MADYSANSITFPPIFTGDQRYLRSEGQKITFPPIFTGDQRYLRSEGQKKDQATSGSTTTTTYWYSVNGGAPSFTTSISSIPVNATLICTVIS